MNGAVIVCEQMCQDLYQFILKLNFTRTMNHAVFEEVTSHLQLAVNHGDALQCSRYQHT